MKEAQAPGRNIRSETTFPKIEKEWIVNFCRKSLEFQSQPAQSGWTQTERTKTTGNYKVRLGRYLFLICDLFQFLKVVAGAQLFKQHLGFGDALTRKGWAVLGKSQAGQAGEQPPILEVIADKMVNLLGLQVIIPCGGVIHRGERDVTIQNQGAAAIFGGIFIVHLGTQSEGQVDIEGGFG